MLLCGLLQLFNQLPLHPCHIFYFSSMLFCPFSVYVHIFAFPLAYLLAGFQRRADFSFVDRVYYMWLKQTNTAHCTLFALKI